MGAAMIGSVDLSSELADAQHLAHHPLLAAAVDTLNLRIDATPWGVATVEMYGETYQPRKAGALAFIVAAEADYVPFDLVACRLSDRKMATRMGLAAVLGEDDIELALDHGVPLPLFRDALHWANGGFRGATVVDWNRARDFLIDLPRIRCASLALATQLDAALKVPPRLPPIDYVRPQHAA